METILKSPVIFSESASKEFKKLQTKEPANNYLRIGVKNGGCSGMSYILNFEEKKPGDDIYNIGEISCIIDPAHLIYLSNMQIDWEGGLSARGFTFNNPNAGTSCGCGSSFAL